MPPDSPEGWCSRCAFLQMLGGPEPGAAKFPRAFGAYDLLGEIARGGMGVVYRARHRELNREVALKVMLAGEFAAPDFLQRFRTEAEAAARLDHPNIVPIFEIGEDHGQPFLSMKLVEGGTLSRAKPAAVSNLFGNADGESEPSTDADWAALVLAKLARAVHYAHQRGILHRDLKPGNVLLDTLGEPFLTDFGLARLVEQDSSLTRTFASLGTPSYMAPEQARGESRQLTTAADVYGLGAILYELLAGRPPFAGNNTLETIRQVLEEEPVPPSKLRPAPAGVRAAGRGALGGSRLLDLETICLKCLEKDPVRRYRSADSLADDLDRWRRDEPVSARPVSTSERIIKWARRKPAKAVALAAVAFALVAVATVSSVMAWRVKHARLQTEASNVRLAKNVRDLEWARAEQLAAADKTPAALAYFSRFVRMDPTNSGVASRLLSLLSLRNFALPLGLPLVHRARVNSVEFDRTGARLLTASHDGVVRWWDARSMTLVWSFPNEKPALDARLSPDGTRLLVSLVDGVVRVVPLGSGAPGAALEFPPPADQHPRAEWSPDGRWIATNPGTNTVQVWHAPTGEPAFPPFRHPHIINRLHFSSTGQHLATASPDGTIQVWDLRTGRLAFPALYRGNRVDHLLFPPGEQELITGDGFGRWVVWSLADGTTLREVQAHRNEITGLALSPDGGRLLTRAYLEPARLWDWHTGQPLGPPLALPGYLLSADFSADGERVAVASREGAVQVFDGRTGEALTQPFEHAGPVNAVRFAPDREFLATASEDGTAQLWDVRMSSPTGLIIRQEEPSRELLFSPDGGRLLTTTRSSGQLRDAHTGEPMGAPMSHNGRISAAAFSPDGRWVATAGNDKLARIWDGFTGEPVSIPMRHGDNILNVVFSPDGRLLATGSDDRTARVWEARTGRPVCPPLEHPDQVLAIELDAKGERLATACLDGRARVWSVPSGQLLMTSPQHRGIVWTAVFSPDGQTLATASADRTAQVLDAASGVPRFGPIRHEKGVCAVRFSPNGAWLVTSTEEGIVRVWNATNGRPVSQPIRHADRTWVAYFTSDGNRVVTGSQDGTARLWDARTGYPVTEPFRHGAMVLRTRLSSDGRRLATSSADNTIRLWDVREIPRPWPNWLADLGEALGGLRMNDEGEFEAVPREQLLGLRKRLSDATGDDFYSRWARWFFVDRLQPTPPNFQP